MILTLLVSTDVLLCVLLQEKGNLDLTAYILIEGADLNAQDEGSRTPLQYAVYSGNIDVVRFLIDLELSVICYTYETCAYATSHILRKPLKFV